MLVGIVAVLLNAYFLVWMYGPDGYSVGMGPHITPPLGLVLLVWGAFAASLFGLWLMWRVWRGSR
jgi:hypothetical protein